MFLSSFIEGFMEFTKQDKTQIETLIKLLGRARFELEGVEVLAASDSMRWLSRFLGKIDEQLNPKPTAPEPIKEPIKKETKTKKSK